MLVLGLTGSIAMGKSRCARLLRLMGVPVLDSDAVVHALYAPGGAAVGPVSRAFPGTRSVAGGIDRVLLGRRVIGDGQALHRLERIVHRLVRLEQEAFLGRAARAGQWIATLDVPLLLETGGERRCDRVAVVSAAPILQRDRALRRPGMTQARLDAILRKQMPDALKRGRADFVIPSGLDRGAMVAALRAMLLRLRGEPGRAWPDRWRGSNGMRGELEENG